MVGITTVSRMAPSGREGRDDRAVVNREGSIWRGSAFDCRNAVKARRGLVRPNDETTLKSPCGNAGVFVWGYVNTNLK